MSQDFRYSVKSYGTLLIWTFAILIIVTLLFILTRGNPYKSAELGFRSFSEVEERLRTSLLWIYLPVLCILFSYTSSLILTYDRMKGTESLVLWGRQASSRVIVPRLTLFFSVLMTTSLILVLLSKFYVEFPKGVLFMSTLTSAVYISGLSAFVAGIFRHPLAGFVFALLFTAFFGILPDNPLHLEYPIKTLVDPYFLLRYPQLISEGKFVFAREGPIFLLNQLWCFFIGLALFLSLLPFFQSYKRHFF